MATQNTLRTREGKKYIQKKKNGTIDLNKCLKQLELPIFLCAYGFFIYLLILNFFQLGFNDFILYVMDGREISKLFGSNIISFILTLGGRKKSLGIFLDPATKRAGE